MSWPPDIWDQGTWQYITCDKKLKLSQVLPHKNFISPLLAVLLTVVYVVEPLSPLIPIPFLLICRSPSKGFLVDIERSIIGCHYLSISEVG